MIREEIENWKRVKNILADALELKTAERGEFIGRMCAGDERLRREVESLLDGDGDESGEFFESIANNQPMQDFFAGDASLVGREIGAYRLVREIGRGGMGVVYLAERSDGEFNQTVAFKLMRHGLDAASVVKKFKRERQILAALDHPFIARLLDGGTTSDGVPYLVMEHVEGIAVDEYCAAKNCPLEDKLDLFRKICAAVQYAHRNLVVHRDLKPSNILINEAGEPKLLDFGIAKLLKNEAVGAGETRTKMLALTPEYASPEQIRGDKLTTATDVYSLGVIFFELLTGARPYKTADVNFEQLVKAICETQPPRPSSIVSRRLRMNDDRQKIYPKAKISNAKSLNGDLDNIALKALQKDAERRYPSVEIFSEDIRRYQVGLPVVARPDTFFYRASKFTKRNRVATVAAVFVFLALIIGSGVALYQARQAKIERERAEQRFEETRSIAKAVIFNYYDEINKLQGATKVRAMMVKDALSYLDRLADDESATQNADLRRELVEGYLRLGDAQGQPYSENLGDTESAFASYEKALGLLENSSDAEETAADLKTRATVYQKMSQILIRRQDARERSVEYAKKVVGLREKIAALEPNTENKIAVAQSWHNLGFMMSTTENIEASLPLLQKALAIIDELLQTEPDNKELRKLNGRYNGRIGYQLSQTAMREMIVWNEIKAGQLYESSVPYFEKAVSAAKRLAADEPENKTNQHSLIVNESNFAEVLAQLGRAPEALDFQRASLAYSQKQIAADPSNQEVKFELAEDYLDMARTFLFLGERATARENFERGIKIIDEFLKADPTNAEFPDFQFANFTAFYGDAQIQTGDLGGALETYGRALDRSRDYANDSPKSKRFRNLMVKMRFGDIRRFKAQKEMNAARYEDLAAATGFYREALDSLTPDADNFEKISKYINEKITECEQAQRSN